MAEVYGNRYCVIARELTKLHETLYRGKLNELVKQFKGAPDLKGEMVLIVEGANNADKQINIEEVRELLHELMQKMSLRDAVQEIENLFGFPRKKIYQLALSMIKK